uniref:uncharacterized protein LOC123462149 isoform X2 n=1 Tax=Jaculus jaculus TaxID=51337 RepID=UPI001E1B5FB4|nr:uncharacterized protein LOC123462149 isoform X2 [Jaculus jaculus]
MFVERRQRDCPPVGGFQRSTSTPFAAEQHLVTVGGVAELSGRSFKNLACREPRCPATEAAWVRAGKVWLSAAARFGPLLPLGSCARTRAPASGMPARGATLLRPKMSTYVAPPEAQ